MRSRLLATYLIGIITILLLFSKQDISKTTGSNLEVLSTPVHLITPTSPLPKDGAYGPYEYPDNVNPLTGLEVDDLAILDRHPIVAKISNAPALVRPQSGIGAADIVFEHYAEGGLTRFSAVFYGQTPARVGSIRSARLIDHELTPMFHGMLVFSGASIGVEKYIYGSDDVHARIQGSELTAPGGPIPPSEYAERAYKGVIYGWPYYWRDETIPVPHNMFANLESIWQLAESESHSGRQPLRGLAFHSDVPPNSDAPAIDIDLRYRTTRINWVYDETTGRYLRFADGQPHRDANTNEQVSAANVVVLYAEHTDTNIIESQWQNSISWSTQIAVWGENSAVLFRDGQRYDARWVRIVREDIITLRTMDDEILYLKPGNTWIQVIRDPQQQDPNAEWLITE